MKKNVFATLLLLVSVVFVSCSSAKKDLRAEVEAANKECPISAGIIGNLSSYEYDEANDEVIMKVSLSENLPLKLSVLSQLKPLIKKSALSNFTKADDVIRLMKDIAKADAKLTIVYQAAGSSENLKVELSKQDVQNVAEGKIEQLTPKESVEITLVATNAQCPMQVDEVTELTSVSLDGNTFVYHYLVDEDQVSMEELEAAKETLRESIKATLTSQDPTLHYFVDACREGNVSIQYHYVGNCTGEESVIEFSPSEL